MSDITITPLARVLRLGVVLALVLPLAGQCLVESCFIVKLLLDLLDASLDSSLTLHLQLKFTNPCLKVCRFIAI